MKKNLFLSLTLLTALATGTLVSNDTPAHYESKSVGALFYKLGSWTAKKTSENYDYYWTGASAKAAQEVAELAKVAAQEAAVKLQEAEALCAAIVTQDAIQLNGEAQEAALRLAQESTPFYTKAYNALSELNISEKATTLLNENKFTASVLAGVVVTGIGAYGAYKLYKHFKPTQIKLIKP